MTNLDEIPDEVLARECARRGVTPPPPADYALEPKLEVLDRLAPTLEGADVDAVSDDVIREAIMAARGIDMILARDEVSPHMRAQANMRRAWLHCEGLPTGYKPRVDANA